MSALRLAGALFLAACAQPREPGLPGPEPVAPAAEPVAPGPTASASRAPDVAFALPTREVRTPARVASTPEIEAARARLVRVVEEHARDPENPWAVAHALLALGPDVVLSNGEPAVDWLIAEYADEEAVGQDVLLSFPASRGAIRIEPHTDLLLKSFAGAGIDPRRTVVSSGSAFEVGDLYRFALSRTWVEGGRISAASHNDLPWTLQALATWAPPDLAWTAQGHATSLDALTHEVVTKLADETAFLREALAAGRSFEKRGQGIFAYTCGGAHLYQGAAYAVARGFGEPGDKETVVAQIPGLYARLDVELKQVDAALGQHPDYAIVLLVQRLKFLGHFLETTHQMAALGLYEPDEAQREAQARAVRELVATVQVLERMGVLDRLADVRKADEQVYLDLVGDSAHAVRGLDLALGTGTVRY